MASSDNLASIDSWKFGPLYNDFRDLEILMSSIPPNGGGKTAERKSRTSNQTTTTFITADPAKIRPVVRQLTGVKFGDGNSHIHVDGTVSHWNDRDYKPCSWTVNSTCNSATDSVKSLKSLHISSGDSLDLSRLTSLKSLELSRPTFLQSFKLSVKSRALSYLTPLKSLELSRLTFLDLSRLTFLDLSRLTSLESFSQPKLPSSLTTLYLPSSNSLKSLDLNSLSRLTFLSIESLDHSGLSSLELPKLPSLTSLKLPSFNSLDLESPDPDSVYFGLITITITSLKKYNPSANIARRNYGQQVIHNAKHPRDYNWCTPKFDQGLLGFGSTNYPDTKLNHEPNYPTFSLVEQEYSHNPELRTGLTSSDMRCCLLPRQVVLPPTTAELRSPYVVDCDDFEDFDDVDDSDDIDRSAGMLPNLDDEFVHGLLSRCGDVRIIVSTTNRRDRHDAALLPLVNVDSYIHTSAPQPIALPDGGEIVQLESSEQKPLVDFDATNNRSCQREASMRSCTTESVLSLVDSAMRISSMDFDAAENRAHLVRAHRSGPIVFNSEKEDAGEGLNGECLTKSVLSSESSDDSTKQNSLPEFDAIENKVVKVYARRGRGCCHSMELEHVAMFAGLGTDPENEVIISDLLRFVRDKEFYKSIGKAWKRGYLFNDSPGTDRSGLIAAMANCLEFDVYDLDLTGLSSISELMHVLVSIGNRSLVVIKDFDHWIGMLPNLKNELTLSGLLKIIHGLLSSCGDERIIVLSTSHNHRDPVDATLLRLLNIDLYIHTSSPQPIALPDVGEIVQLDSSEQKPSVDFGATNNWAYQSNSLVSNSEEKNTREVSRRQCMTGSVLGLVYPTTRISLTDFDAPDNSAHLVRAYLTIPVVFNLEKKYTGEGLNKECLTKGVIGLDNSSKQKSLPYVDTTENKAHLVSSYQSGPAVSLSENNNRGEALKRECISKSILGLEDLQQHSGVIYDPGLHTTYFLGWKSYEVLETLPTREQPNDCVPLLSLGRLTLKGCVQEEKSPDLPTVMQINGVEHRIKKLPTCLGGLTAQSARSSRWPISLPDGRHIVLLDPLEQSTKNVAHEARADKCSPTVSLPEKKMMRKTWKRECRTMNVVFEIHQQHFGRRCEGTAKRFRAKHICRKHGINQVSVMKRHKRHGIHQWPFRQKWATRKGYSLGDKRPYEVSSLSMDEKLDSRLLLIHMSKFARSSPRPLALPNGGEIVGPIALSSSECAATNNVSHFVRQDQSGSTTSHYERKNTREMSQGITMSLFCEENLQQPFGCKHKDAVKRLDVNVSMFKGTCRQHRYYWWPCRIEKNEQEAFDATNNGARLVKADQSGLTMSTSEKEDTGEALKRECITKSVLSLENLCQHYGVWFHTPDSNAWKPFEERQELQFHTPDSLARKSFEELNVLPLCKQSNCIRRVVPQRRLVLKHWVRLKKSQDLPGTVQMNCSRGLTTQSASSLHGPIGLPDGGHNVSLSKKKIVRKTFKRKCRAMSVSFEDHQQQFSCRCDGAVNSLGANHIYKQHGINLVPTAKRIRGQHWIHRCPCRQDGGTMKGYTLGDERPVEVISLSTDGKLVSRLQLIYMSWLGRISPPPSVLPGGEIVGHIALSSSEFATTNSIAQRVGQDQGGSGASGSENERTREQQDPKEIYNSISKDDLLRLYGRMNRTDAAASLGVSVSTFKRKCRDYEIDRWKHIRKKKVGRPPDQHGEGNTSTAHETPSHHVQTGMEGGPVGQNHEANECRRDFMERQITLNPENSLIIVSSSPDQYGERNTSTARETPSHNVQIGIQGVPVGQNQEANEFQPDFTEGSIPLNVENGLIGCSFGRASQVNDQSTLSTPYLNHDAIGFPPPQITSMPSVNMGGSIDLRNSLASQVVLDGHISGSPNSTFATCSDQAASSQHVQGQSMHPTVYPDHSLFPQTQIVSPQEPFSEGHVFGFSNGNEHVMMIKAFYPDGDNTIFKFPFPLTSGIVDLKKEVSKRLNVEVDTFVVKYKDKYEDLISILCNDDLMLYLLSSLGNDEINVLVLDKVGGTPNFCEKCRSSMQTRA